MAYRPGYCLTRKGGNGDYSSPVTRGTQDMSARQTQPVTPEHESHKNNQSEDGVPARSVFGTALRAALATGKVVRQMDPILPSKSRYLGFFGVNVVRAARVNAVIERKRYKGQLPMREQSTLRKPKPWEDPLRGSP